MDVSLCCDFWSQLLLLSQEVQAENCYPKIRCITMESYYEFQFAQTCYLSLLAERAERWMWWDGAGERWAHVVTSRCVISFSVWDYMLVQSWIREKRRESLGSGLMIFIGTDAFVNIFGNILDSNLSFLHTTGDFSSPFFLHFHILFCSTSYPPVYLFFSVPGTEHTYLKWTASGLELVEHFLDVQFELA